MIPLPIFSQRIFVIAAISATSAVLAGLFFYQVGAQPLSRVFGYGAASSGNTVYLSGDTAAAAAASSTEESSTFEVHIANNGLTLLRGARVLSVSGSTIRVGMSWGSSDFSWKVQTTGNTKFFGPKGEKETSNDIHIGEVVTITGMIERGGAEPLINAQFVRE